MPSAASIHRARSRRGLRSNSLRRWSQAGLGVAIVIPLAAGGLAWAAATSLDRLTSDLPPVAELETLFGPPGQEHVSPPVFTDRSGRYILPSGGGIEVTGVTWLRLGNGNDTSFMPSAVAHAAVAGLDPNFWTRTGSPLEDMIRAGAAATTGQAPALSLGIPERLVEVTLIPIEAGSRSSFAEWARRAWQASRLVEHFPKERILEWYLNSADFGRAALGIDAAARAYLGKPGHDLTLSESALLVGLLIDPAASASLDLATEVRNQVLGAMAEAGLIRARDAVQATSESVRWLEPDPEERSFTEDYVDEVRRELGEVYGPAAASRPGLRVRTTLDLDLQMQADCTLRTHLARMAGGDPDLILPARDGSTCLAAGLLPPMRPGDSAMAHGVARGAVVILDPAAGEILAWVGGAAESRPAESLLQPFYYLTAFSRGYSPATMILDIPAHGRRAEGTLGPVRMRIALANGLREATRETLGLLDLDQLLRVGRQMGLRDFGSPPAGTAAWDPSQSRASLIDLAVAYGILEDAGRMTGRLREPSANSLDALDLAPRAFLEVADSNGAIARLASEARIVLSQGLAYLMTNVLTDESARLVKDAVAGTSAVGRSAGAVEGEADEGGMRWTVGFASPLVAGVWIAAPPGQALQGVDAYNGSAPVWRALIQYSTRDLPRQETAPPEGVSQVDVCDPSGLLPTTYCPHVVREVFLQGTEPTHYDTLYQPFRVNRETGKLATLFTPLDLIEDRVYLVPPPAAEDWALAVGLPQPPNEYDTLPEIAAQDPQANLQVPLAFDVLHGRVAIRGTAQPEALDFYRLQYGEGLNPSHWVSVGEEVRRIVRDGLLGIWDTAGLNGLFTLQLIVVERDGRVRTSALPLILDNLSPQVRLVYPLAGARLVLSVDGPIVLEAEATDSVLLNRVEFFLDGRRVGEVLTAPYSLRMVSVSPGEHSAFVRAYDGVGNSSQSEMVTFTVAP